MRKAWAWSLAGAGVLIGAIVIWNSGPELATLHFADGTTSGVLKVSVGTKHHFSWEPTWKQCMRTLLPESFQKRLGPVRTSKFSTANDSLVLFLDPIPRGGDALGEGVVEAFFSDGTVFATRWNPIFSTPITIDNYPRDQKQILLRFTKVRNNSDERNKVEVKVPNPRPAKRQSWSAQPLPQTNHIIGTEIVLKNFSGMTRSEVTLDASTMRDPVSWIQWRTTLFDPLGNWCTDSSMRRPAFPGARSERVLKLVAEGNEYISAGFFPIPTNWQYHIVPIRARMTNWGVRFVALFGPGKYEVSNALEIKTRNSVGVKTNLLNAARSSWLIECVQPVTFCISERPVAQVRLRERLPYDKGNAFYGWPTATVSKGSVNAQLFTPRIATAVTTTLEAEVVVRWPAVEFFVEKPK